jgi:hypothetical protein
MKNIWPMALSPITATAKPARQLVAHHNSGRRQQLQDAEDQRDPAPSAQVAEHVVRVSDEHVRVGDRGDAIDQIEATGHHQWYQREPGQAVATVFGAPAPAFDRLKCCRRHLAPD